MGRRANAAVLERQTQAISLHNAGHSYDEIAEELGFAGRGSAWKCVDRGLQSRRDLRADEYMTTQLDRYEGILRAYWSDATIGGDPKAALVVLRAMERLDKVLRLTDGPRTVSQESIVIAADPETYVAQLRQVVEERDGL